MLYHGESCSSVACVADSVYMVPLIVGCFLATGVCVQGLACMTHLETLHSVANMLNASVLSALD